MRNFSGYLVPSSGSGGVHYLEIKDCFYDLYWSWHCKECKDYGIFIAHQLQAMDKDGTLIPPQH